MTARQDMAEQLDGYIVQLNNLRNTVKGTRPVSPHLLLERLTDLRDNMEGYRDHLRSRAPEDDDEDLDGAQVEASGMLAPPRPPEPPRGNQPRRRKEPPEGASVV